MKATPARTVSRPSPRGIPFSNLDEHSALRAIVEGTATDTGETFFASLVRNLAGALDVNGAWVTEYLEPNRRLRAIAFYINGGWISEYEYNIAGTPCEPVIDKARLVHFPDRLMELYPLDPDLPAFGAVSYIGIPLTDQGGRILGHLAVLDNRPMPEDPRCFALIRIFAARAAAELQRIRAEAVLRDRERQLSGVVEGAMDAILELDANLAIRLVNSAASTIFRCPPENAIGHSFEKFLSAESAKRFRHHVRALDGTSDESRRVWLPGTLEANRRDGSSFHAEATLSSVEREGKPCYIVVLRDVNERLEAEKTIHALATEAEYLREEVRLLGRFDQILGRSPALLRVLREVDQVAPTDSTVLIMGETGTGKELIARAIHGASPRSAKPLVTVNCAAVPATLIESEFFGHEAGAFTGATRRREGRFTLADGGTIFLDEIGELPLDLQAKLLRVLQEGEFESVGGTRTQKVSVRVVAATNRDLQQAVNEGKFREDLYYRLHVIPITLPPLRQRGEDVVILATEFAKMFARKMGRTFYPLSMADAQWLRTYDWPGNVRELQNVIERAVITSTEGRLNLDRALPDAGPSSGAQAAPAELEPVRILTATELHSLERDNIRRALRATQYKVSGKDGAAERLGMKPSTLASRIKALGLQRSR